MENQSLNCLIVDDEPMALKLVESYVQKTPFLTLKAKCNNAIEALDYVSSNSVDLIFLDIQMPELSGLELSKMLPKNCRIIFTTAFNQYAVEGFKVEALDYLLKPFDYAEFLAAANKAKAWFQLLHQSQTTAESPASKDFIFVKSGYNQERIALSSILYFEGLKDYIKIHIEGQSKSILTLMSLRALQEQLPASQFLRVHRSYIVSLAHIERIERNQVIIGNERITVSEAYREDFQKFIKANSL